MPHDLNVRQATLVDISECQKIDQELSETTALTVFQSAIENKKVLVAEREGSILGYLRYSYLWEQKLPYIQVIRVNLWAQRQGVGTSLVNTLCTILQNQHISAVLSSTDFDNQLSIQFHHKLGFKDCGTLAINVDGSNEVFFIKKLR